jgi:hypothetical protein
MKSPSDTTATKQGTSLVRWPMLFELYPFYVVDEGSVDLAAIPIFPCGSAPSFNLTLTKRHIVRFRALA